MLLHIIAMLAVLSYSLELHSKGFLVFNTIKIQKHVVITRTKSRSASSNAAILPSLSVNYDDNEKCVDVQDI